MQFESYIQQKKNQYQDILNFLEDESQDVSTSQEMCNTIKQFFSSLQKNEMQEELTIFLHLIISISDNHFRNTNSTLRLINFYFIFLMRLSKLYLIARFTKFQRTPNEFYSSF